MLEARGCHAGVPEPLVISISGYFRGFVQTRNNVELFVRVTLRDTHHGGVPRWNFVFRDGIPNREISYIYPPNLEFEFAKVEIGDRQKARNPLKRHLLFVPPTSLIQHHAFSIPS